MQRFVVNGICAGLVCLGLSANAEAESLVKTPQECTRYGGSLSRSTELPTHPYACETPEMDDECMAAYDEDYYFDAEFGRCFDALCLDLGGTETECAAPLN